MEDDLDILENGRRPQYSWKWKTISIFLKMEDDLNIFLMKATQNPKQIRMKTMVVAPLRVT